MANVIYRGDLRITPRTINGAAAKDGLLPGMALIKKVATGELDSAAANETDFLIMNNRDFCGFGVDDAAKKEETVIGYEVEKARVPFQVRLKTGVALTKGDKLAVDANGYFIKAIAGTTAVMGYEGVDVTAVAPSQLVDAYTIFPVVVK